MKRNKVMMMQKITEPLLQESESANASAIALNFDDSEAVIQCETALVEDAEQAGMNIHEENHPNVITMTAAGADTEVLMILIACVCALHGA